MILDKDGVDDEGWEEDEDDPSGSEQADAAKAVTLLALCLDDGESEDEPEEPVQTPDAEVVTLYFSQQRLERLDAYVAQPWFLDEDPEPRVKRRRGTRKRKEEVVLVDPSESPDVADSLPSRLEAFLADHEELRARFDQELERCRARHGVRPPQEEMPAPPASMPPTSTLTDDQRCLFDALRRFKPNRRGHIDLAVPRAQNALDATRAEAEAALLELVALGAIRSQGSTASGRPCLSTLVLVENFCD